MATMVTASQTTRGALTPAERELASIGASVGSGCHPCLTYHLQAGTEAGLSTAELNQALADAECVKRSAYNQLAVLGRTLLGEAVDGPAACCSDMNPAKELVSIGSAVGANSIAEFEKHATSAREVGLSAAQIAAAITVAQAVQRQAAALTADAVAAHTGAASAGAVGAPIWLTAPVAAPASAGCGPDCGCKSE